MRCLITVIDLFQDSLLTIFSFQLPSSPFMIDMEFSSSCTPRLLVLAISVGSVVRMFDVIW